VAVSAPDTHATIEDVQPVGRGHHKVFLGMAAGVGKTYQMLREGQAEAENGRDVVIGYLEPHGRVETVAQADGLETVPRRRVAYRDSELEEMDLPALLRRHPELALIDELAHTNAPGLEHRKRYEDVDDVLAAGIDVFSTVNVQHLESLNDQVAELTGIRVRETIPDAVLGAADEVILIDITPQSLVERLRAGKVYPQERVQAALNNFFKVENLSALREVALRQVAEEVEAKRIPVDLGPGHPVGSGRPDDERLIGNAATAAVGERLLALVTPQAKSQRVVRRAWRSAQRLGADLDVLWVADHEPSEEEREQLDALRRLSSVLGAHLLLEHGDDVAAVAQRVAQDRGTTYVLMGTPRPRSALRRLTQTSLPFRLLELLPGVDLRIVADRTQRTKGDSI
jgi:two-component system, OmpR family, sensor histidine kinase KdpD